MVGYGDRRVGDWCHARQEDADVIREVDVRNGEVGFEGDFAEQDVDFNGVTIEAGDKVLMNFPAANHDPEQFERPDEFIIDRERNRHVAFGSGIHRCAGSNLARLEMTTALRVWLERIPESLVSDPSSVVWAGGQVRGPRSIPMSLAAN
ncbi:MAG: cytochrome P450 [Actinomycetota bacterium]|nr:cytochrome P450 [Actinomycetota bacterium]